jgi:hypothetical protein
MTQPADSSLPLLFSPITLRGKRTQTTVPMHMEHGNG